MARPKRKRRYYAPLDPIPHRPDDEPTICLQVNAFWIAYLLFAIDTGRYPESWLGTLEENKQARADVNRLIDMLVLAEDCADMITVNCCCEDKVTLTRVNPITLQIEISIDNGTTWTPSPDSPIANAIAQPPPVPAGVSGTKCDAATNGQAHIGDIILSVSENLQTAITVFELAVAIAAALLEIALIILTGGLSAPAAVQIAAIIWAAASAVFNMGKVAFDDYWTQDQRDKILCALYCHISDDGSFTENGYNAFIADWKQRSTPSPAFNLVLNEVQAIGRVGLNNLCAYGNAANSDCASCECAGCPQIFWVSGGVAGDVPENLVQTGDCTWDRTAALNVPDGKYYAQVCTTADQSNPNLCAKLWWSFTPEYLTGNPAVWRCGESSPNYSTLNGTSAWLWQWWATEPFVVHILTTNP